MNTASLKDEVISEEVPGVMTQRGSSRAHILPSRKKGSLLVSCCYDSLKEVAPVYAKDGITETLMLQASHRLLFNRLQVENQPQRK